MTPDLKAAETFYREVVGWTIADSGMPGMTYLILRAQGADLGGMMALPRDCGLPSMWTGYIYSADVEADCRRAVSLGGSVMKEPEDIPGVGRFAVLADPGGAAFNIFRPQSSGTRAEIPPGTPGRVAWNNLAAGDGRREWAFYEAMFGWTKTQAHEMGPGMIYQTFAAGPNCAGGMMTATPAHPARVWTFFFAVDGIDSAAARVRAQGGRILMEPMEVPGGDWIVEAADPFGANFGLVAPKR